MPSKDPARRNEQKRIRRSRISVDVHLAHLALKSCYPFEIEDLDGEEWRDISGYEGLYQVSNYGRIKSYCKRNVRILSPHVDKEGYLGVTLCKEHVKTKYKLHRIVAQAFIPNPENKETVNHIDGCKMNNYVGNLEWATRTENNRHAAKFGLMKFGADYKYTTLTNEQVEYCRSVYIPGDPEYGASALARKFCVSHYRMWSVITGRK